MNFSDRPWMQQFLNDPEANKPKYNMVTYGRPGAQPGGTMGQMQQQQSNQRQFGSPFGAGATSPFGKIGQIGSAFSGPTPQPFQNTQQHVNQSVADIHQQNSPQWLRKMHAPSAASGVAQSAGTESVIAPFIANANVQANLAQHQIPFERGMGNAQFGLGWEQARSADTLGQAGNLAQQSDLFDNFQMNQFLRQFGLLGNLFGGAF